jgi:hypothetical protein
VINNYHQAINLSPASTAVFVHYYNENIPEAFPRATLKALEKFQILHPSLFKENNGWTIDRHRKKLIDWLSSYKE